MTLLFVLFGLLAISYFGYLLILNIDNKLNILEYLSLGYLLGLGVFTYLMFFSNLAGFAYNFVNILGLLIILVLLFAFLLKFRKIKLTQKIKFKKLKLDKNEKIFLFAILFVSSMIFIASLYWPVKDWDSLVLYDFRAKVFLDTGFMEKAIEEGYFFGYPLMTSLSHLLVYLFGFKQPGIIHSLFYICFLLISFSHLKDELERKQALFWTMILSLTPELFGPANMTYSNLAYTVYLLISLLYLLKWAESNKDSYLLISALLLGLSTWVRSSEPFWLILVIFVWIISWTRKKWYLLITYPSIVYAFLYPWSRFEKLHNAEVASALNRIPQFSALLVKGFDISNFISVIKYFYLHIIFPNKLIYLLFVLISILLWQKRRRAKLTHWLPIFFVLFSLGITFMGIYLFSLFYEDWGNIGGSATRMTMFIVPSIIYSAALIINLANKELKILNLILQKMRKS
ncbi:MAG: hypothetical protein ABFQ62_00480 [Patescibacteria group bacterium]